MSSLCSGPSFLPLISGRKVERCRRRTSFPSRLAPHALNFDNNDDNDDLGRANDSRLDLLINPIGLVPKR